MTFHHLRAPRSAAAPSAARQPGPVTLALRAMAAHVTVPPASGPVTAAIRTMRAADPAFDLNPDLIAIRRALADRIEADIAALDMLGGDPDLEADYTRPVMRGGIIVTSSMSTDDEPSLCGVGGHSMNGHAHEYPEYTGNCGDDLVDIEGTNEDGSDDDLGEESLGWPANIGQLALGTNTADGEHSLGSLGGTAAGCEFASQMAWAGGARDDREEENEHGSDDDQGEDSLGSLNGTVGGVALGQVTWAGGRPGDYEADVHDEPHDPESDERDTSPEWSGHGEHVFSFFGQRA